MNGVWAVFYREVMFFKPRAIKTVLSSIVYPALFLLAFGYGLGKNAKVNGMDYIAFLIPGLITMSSMNQAYSISLEIHISRYYFKIFEEYLLAPIRRWEIVVGELLYGIMKGTIPAFFITIYAILSGMVIKISPLFIFCLLLHLTCFSLIGYIIAMVVKSHADQAAFSSFVMVPMIFLSDTFYPIDKMPVIAKYIGYLFPLTYSTKLIRGALLGAHEFLAFKNFAILFVITVALFFVAIKVTQKAEVV